MAPVAINNKQPLPRSLGQGDEDRRQPLEGNTVRSLPIIASRELPLFQSIQDLVVVRKPLLLNVLAFENDQRGQVLPSSRDTLYDRRPDARFGVF